MTEVRRYIPLIGFVVPTLLIGYGFVIPRSCIAGINELSVGFGTTVLGAALTYIAGQRAMQPARVCTKPPLGLRIYRAINRQAASPRGWFGRLLGWLWPHEHAAINAEVLDQLELAPGQRVLEIGSGPGVALREVAHRVQDGGHVLGLDVSPLMVRLARENNRDGVQRGRVDVRLTDGSARDLQPESFDRAYSVHSIYFWSDPQTTVSEIARALRPGARLVLAFRPEGPDIPARFRGPTYRFPATDVLEAIYRRVGFHDVRVQSSKTAPHVVLVIGTKA